MEQGTVRASAAVRRSGESVDQSESTPRRASTRLPSDSALDGACALVARIAAGDAAAEQEFARRYAASVASLLNRQCRGSGVSAEDLRQDVLCRVLVKLRTGALQDGNALWAHLERCAWRAAWRALRRRARQRPRARLDAAGLGTRIDAVHGGAVSVRFAWEPRPHHGTTPAKRRLDAPALASA